MAPIKHRFSIRAYAGKRQPKQSLNAIQEDDAFDKLLQNKISTSHIFESSSEKPISSSQSKDDSETSNIKSLGTTRNYKTPSSCERSSMNHNKIKTVSGRNKIKRKKKYTKANYLQFLKDNMYLSDESGDDHQFVSSTPILQNIRRLRGSNGSNSYPKIKEKNPRRLDLLNNELINDLKLTPIKFDCKKNSDVLSGSNSVCGISQDSLAESIDKDKNSYLSCTTQNDKPHGSPNSDQEKGKTIKTYKKSLDHEIVRSYLSDLEISHESPTDFSERSEPKKYLSSINLTSRSLEENSIYQKGYDSSMESSFGEDALLKHNDSVPLGVHPNVMKENYCTNNDNSLLSEVNESISLQENTEFYSAEEDSLRKLEVKTIEEAFSKLSMASKDNQMDSWSPVNNINTRRRKYRPSTPSGGSSISSNQSLNPIYLPQHQNLNISDKGSSFDKRKVCQRLSRSLPASFRDKPPYYYSERFILSDSCLNHSRKSLSRLRDEFLYPYLSCSTHSLPAVLEDQDKESQSDNELTSHRLSYSYRKTNLDSSQGNQFFLGFTNADGLKARRNLIKKFNSEELPCTSPYTLPALLEDESDSSCEEEEWKKMESGSSSQVESPLMSPGVQGSPSRRGSTRISTSNSSETSLSSRSEGIISPLQDEMGNMLSPRASSPDVAAVSSEEDSASSPVKRDEQRRRRLSRLTRRTLGYIAEETESDSSEPKNIPIIARERLVLMTGKKYRRSLAILHNLMDEETLLTDEHKGRSYIQSVEAVKMLQREDSFHGDSDDSSDMSPDPRRSLTRKVGIPRNKSHRLSTTIFCVNSNPVDVSVVYSCLPSFDSIGVSQVTLLDSPHQSINDTDLDQTLSCAEDMILRISNQERPLDLNNLYADNSLETWEKIGEGVYSEVFSLCRLNEQPSVLKIIPVDGDIKVNGGAQKTLEDNISEVLITHFLSQLRDCTDYSCSGFVQLLRVWYLEGTYPEELIKLWNDFDINNGSDNDRPTIFPTNQRYLGLELVNSGRALESYRFSSARQSIAVFKQVVFSLAVAETMYEFEHRDLHWGNILVDKTKYKTLDYKIDSETYSVTTNGVRAIIIDYTWSALTYGENNVRIVNDMEQDSDLFLGSGDFQFEVYRLMRQDVEQDWHKYQPKTNLRWLYYLADKLINRAQYLRPSANAHKNGIAALRKILDFIPHCDNSLQVAIELLNYK